MNQSLYKRRLPHQLIAFASNRGKQIFKEALDEGNMESYFELSQQFLTQDRPEDCGLSTLVMVLNTLGIDPGKTWHYPWRWYSEDLLHCGQRDPDGIELNEFVQLALCNKTWAMGFYPAIQKEKEMKINIKSSCNLHPENVHFRFASLDTFRSAIVSASRRSGFVIAVNSSRKALEQTGEGHYSPLGGYHSGTDMCLLLDVARFKYPAYWLPVPLMYEALERKDPASGNSRGFILLSRSKKHFPETCTVSMDITSLKHLPRPVTEDLLVRPTQDFLALIVHYFFTFYEDLTQDVIEKIENQLKEVEEPVLNPQLLNLIKEMNPSFSQSTKLVSLGFSRNEFEQPLNGFLKKLRRDLGLSIS
ncbi:unnamed protein product [Blepharisma stoltei]|uniref:glutathione gamma-glutamylcysteinyltransferase n=1 Tax=Blepharisma stoltei TaxID=1481888 RepID=A0AAU9JZL8_9CILI|nr:unnamed protein product [Blepharisma stoltei]